MRVKIILRGAVQGVGFRPFVHRLASEMRLAGWVNNSPQGVFIEAESERPVLDTFLCRLKSEKPPHSFIQSMETAWLAPAGFKNFEIRASDTRGGKTAVVLPDIATCPDCLREIFDPANRRHRYPFTNCTHCGPRFSIIRALPYDRRNTTMEPFEMCPQCRAEYNNPDDRRFHAQPNACPACGPHLELWNGAGEKIFGCNDALAAAANAIRRGKIVAVKCIGGFHLMVDAGNEVAVRELRKRKRRDEKPFALLFPSLERIKETCALSGLEERLLTSSEAPIVLLTRHASRISHHVSPAVAPGNPYLGIMLPSNPLHHLLMAELKIPVVATSGNLSDEPICIDEQEALQRLNGIADLFLVHNRPIVRHVDDSIVRVIAGREAVLRRARGFAPLPVALRNSDAKTENAASAPAGVLAVGAHLKNSVALAVGEQVFISQHIGDLETEPANNAFRTVVADLQRLYDTAPGIVAADLHPDYLSTRFAAKAVNDANLKSIERQSHLFGVQHHVAHVLSCIAENAIELPALGIAWDGTGYGTDSTIWGGEFFIVTPKDVERIAHLRPFQLPGGDTAVKEPRRAAIGVLFEVSGEAAFLQANATTSAFSSNEQSLVKTMLQRKLNSPQTTSMGRVFDAVASLTGISQRMRFEGQAAMELEFALNGIETSDAYPFPIVKLQRVESKPPFVLDFAPMIEAILADIRNGVTAGMISAKFHNALAEAAVAVARQAGLPRVALSGGCFQNKYLAERTIALLRQGGFEPFWHRSVPPNDGGIALGQVFAAIHQLKLK